MRMRPGALPTTAGGDRLCLCGHEEREHTRPNQKGYVQCHAEVPSRFSAFVHRVHRCQCVWFREHPDWAVQQRRLAL